MRVSLILANPKPGSFNHAIAEAALQTLRQNGHHVSFHDLCQEGFDPVLPYQEIPKVASLDPVIQKHCHEIAHAEGIIIVHPNWWGQPPAILKGWIDRVIGPEWPMNFWRATAARGFREVCCRPKLPLSSIRLILRQSGSERSLAIHWRLCGRTA